jgi:hypothetical protein
MQPGSRHRSTSDLTVENLKKIAGRESKNPDGFFFFSLGHPDLREEGFFKSLCFLLKL